MGIQTEELSFGTWVRQQRRKLDFSRQALADQVGCAEITLRRIEAGTLKPSKELARLLLEKLEIPKGEQEQWIRFARGLSGFPTTLSERIAAESQSNLPVFLTKFIGREKEQSEIIQLLIKNRLVTLAGPGGVGKTRLAGIVGEQVQEEYSSGVWMIELAPLNDPALVPQTVAGLFGITTRSEIPYTELLINFLRSKNTLLILDNCEHVLQACADLTHALLTHCPKLKILVTSREPLQVMGEAIYQVPSLGIPKELRSLKKYRALESVRLFEERAQLAQSGFAVTLENVSSVVQICRRLDGIPLAIELAAARMDMLSVEQIAVRLRESFDLLTGGSRTVLPRQQTIRGSMDWSWNLLSEQERLFLCRLSIFSGGWTLEAAEMVCSGDGIERLQVAELMRQLVAKSLVVVSQDKGRERRYGLHEIIRQYAREKLNPEGEESTRTRHLKYYLEFSKQAEPALAGPDQMDWVARLRVEQDNIRLALDWASRTDVKAGLNIIGCLGQDVDLREGLHWLSIFLKNPESHKYPHSRAKGLLAQADYQWVSEQFEAARISGEESLALFRACGDPHGECGCLLVLGSVYQFLEGMDRKIELHLQALALAKSLGDRLKVAHAVNGLGWDRRDNQRAIQYWEQATAMYRQIGNWRSLLFLLGIYADTVLANGQAEEAHRLLEEALALNQRINFRRGMEFVLVAKSREALLNNQFTQARAYIQEWIEIAEETGIQMGYLWGRARLGYVALSEGSLEEGARILCETAGAFHADRNKAGMAFTLEKLAHFFVRSNQLERAARLIGWADKSRVETGDVRPKLEQMDIDGDLAVCVSQLGEEAVTAILDQGSAMALDEVAALALEGW